jgi:hypothetical protein
MMARSGFEGLLMVHSEVEEACGLLASPSAEMLDRCARVLESACSDLVSCRSWLSGSQGNPEALAEARRLQASVRRASLLLQIARDYYQKWSQTWVAMTSGYTARGETPPPVRWGLVSLMG